MFAELALLVAPVAIGVLEGLLQPLERDAVVGGGPADEAFRLVEDLLMPGVDGNAAFHTCHGSDPLSHTSP
jgi:hypothetical protein